MGKVIICSGRLAGKPFVPDGTDKRLYSIEEICHYVNNNVYSIDMKFFSHHLTDYIKEELKLPAVADKLKRLVEDGFSLNDVITALFCGCDLYSKDEILETIELVKSLEKMPDWERKAFIGYKKLEEKKYLAALKCFRGTLKVESHADRDYGLVLKAMGICLIHVSSFREAANCFYTSYKYTGSNKALLLAILALKLGGHEKEFNEKVGEFTTDEAVISKAESVWKETERLALNSENISRIENVFGKLKTYKVAEGYKEIEFKLEEFKTEYREGAWNGLIS